MRVDFLIYVARSGSTFFAAKMNEHDGLYVTTESNFIANLVENDFVLQDSQDVDRLVADLYAEKKFRDWGIARQRISARFNSLHFPAGVEQIIAAVFEEHPEYSGEAHVLAKVPRLIRFLDRALGAMPNSKFIHVVRDPRAVSASQRQSISSRTGKAMAGTPFVAALRWRRATARVRAISSARVKSIRFEDMISDPEKIVSECRQFLSLDDMTGSASQNRRRRYVNRIPESQRHLHSNVSRPADASRLDGWRSQLNCGEQFLVERICDKTMRRFGYQPSTSRKTFSVYTQVMVSAAKGIGDFSKAILTNIMDQRRL